jgi:hypothetical protein
MQSVTYVYWTKGAAAEEPRPSELVRCKDGPVSVRAGMPAKKDFHYLTEASATDPTRSFPMTEPFAPVPLSSSRQNANMILSPMILTILDIRIGTTRGSQASREWRCGRGRGQSLLP